MRGLKITTTPILPGYQLFYNYIRPHMALNGRTPADLMRYRNRRAEQMVDPNSKCSKGDDRKWLIKMTTFVNFMRALILGLIIMSTISGCKCIR
jgi:hypothetical protein